MRSKKGMLKCAFRIQGPIFVKCQLKRITQCRALGALCIPKAALFQRVSESIDHPIKYSWNQQQQPPFCLHSLLLCWLTKIWTRAAIQEKKQVVFFASAPICIRVRISNARLLLFMLYCCVCIDLMAYYPPPPDTLSRTHHWFSLNSRIAPMQKVEAENFARCIISPFPSRRDQDSDQNFSNTSGKRRQGRLPQFFAPSKIGKKSICN